MAQIKTRDIAVRKYLMENEIATIESLKTVAKTNAPMTVYRCLSRLGYLVSYSHRGRFYTLKTTPQYDANGLWSCQSAMFSQYGNLLETTVAFANQSDTGVTASELEKLLHVETKHALLGLYRSGKIGRTRLDGRFVYLSAEKGERRRQELMRKESNLKSELGTGIAELLPDEMRAAIILFFSLLDEKERRLYAGLEAAKLGHGGDRKIAELLGLECHTVAKGRRELFGDKVERGRTRRTGGGRKKIEKKSPK